MSKYSDPITATGSLISFDAPFGGVFDSLSVPITPTQDLNGYANPWPAGGGKNAMPSGEAGTKKSNGITVTSDGHGHYTVSGTSSSAAEILFDLETEFTIPTSDTHSLFFMNDIGVTGVTFYFRNGSTNVDSFGLSTANRVSPSYVTIGGKVCNRVRFYISANTAIPGTMHLSPMIVTKDVTGNSFIPYSNICPISGRTGLSVYDDPKYGGSVYWNQQMPIVNKASVTNLNGVDVTNNNDGSFTLNGTAAGATVNYWFMGAYSASDTAVATFKKDHIYFFTAVNVGYPTTSNAGTYTYAGSTFAESVGFFTKFATDDYKSRAVRLARFRTGKQYTNLKIYPQMVDITEVFGSTKADEIYAMEQAEAGSGVAYFKALFYKDYYPYNSGTTTCVSAVNGDPYWKKDIDWTTQAGTVYGGTRDIVTGVLTVDRASISSYAGETLPGAWISDRDVYAPGASPTTGAQVVYELATPLTYQLTGQEIEALVGTNNVWVDTSAVITLIYRLLQVDRQTDRTSIGKRAESLEVLGKFSSISKVEVNVTENLFYEAGDSSGRTLTVDCPFGTQAMANNLLAVLQGYVYQPFEARRSIANPATELGDGVTVGDVYGGIYAIYHKCGPLHLADLSAPADEEIDHEYKFTPAFERKVERRLNNMQSELSVQAGEISAKVDRQGGDPSSVSWKMDADVFKVAVDGSDVLTVNENGLTVNGDGNFTGNVYAGNIQYGGSAGTMSGNGITSRSIGTGRLTSGINTSLGNADYAADVFAGAVTARYMKASSMTTSGLNFMGNTMLIYKKTVKDGNGNNITLKYLGTL